MPGLISPAPTTTTGIKATPQQELAAAWLGAAFIYDILLIVRTLKIKGRAQINYTWSGYHREVPSASKNSFNNCEADSKLARKPTNN